MHPLAGKIIISTRPRSNNDAFVACLEKKGASVLQFPLIEIVPAQMDAFGNNTLKNLHGFEQVIFTSKNGVKYFFDLLAENAGTVKLNPHVHFSVIGKRTALELKKNGFHQCFISNGNTSNEFLNELLLQNIENQNILLVTGVLAGNTLQNGLEKITRFTRLNVYNTCPVNEYSKELALHVIGGKYNLLVFASPSAVDVFFTIMQQFTLTGRYKIACIGKTTAAQIRHYLAEPALTASNPEGSAFAAEVERYLLLNQGA